MPPTNATEEIIEKKTGSPIATACLILAVVALVGSIVLQVMEVADYRRGGNIPAEQKTPGAAKAKKDAELFHNQVEEILNRKGPGVDATPTTDETKNDTKPDEAKKPDDAKAGDTEKEGDAPKADETQPDDSKGAVKPADAEPAKNEEPAEEK